MCGWGSPPGATGGGSHPPLRRLGPCAIREIGALGGFPGLRMGWMSGLLPPEANGPPPGGVDHPGVPPPPGPPPAWANGWGGAGGGEVSFRASSLAPTRPRLVFGLKNPRTIRPFGLPNPPVTWERAPPQQQLQNFWGSAACCTTSGGFFPCGSVPHPLGFKPPFWFYLRPGTGPFSWDGASAALSRPKVVPFTLVQILRRLVGGPPLPGWPETKPLPRCNSIARRGLGSGPGDLSVVATQVVAGQRGGGPPGGRPGPFYWSQGEVQPAPPGVMAPRGFRRTNFRPSSSPRLGGPHGWWGRQTRIGWWGLKIATHQDALCGRGNKIIGLQLPPPAAYTFIQSVGGPGSSSCTALTSTPSPQSPGSSIPVRGSAAYHTNHTPRPPSPPLVGEYTVNPAIFPLKVARRRVFPLQRGTGSPPPYGLEDLRFSCPEPF
ncbi:hypothetical protein GWK47_023228 [Chionoecetes opilio]|uniref:Uncharacterized protein n=1 Tax=Chionoecetes opilio TaxID=41210 RepID=A0A8J4XRF9_CHIOP|nr:hypothetical protein GWK47_023228 [Chionoecetes opilio]